MMEYFIHLILLISLCRQIPAVAAQRCYRPEIPAFAAITPSSDTYRPRSAVSYSCTNGQTPTGGTTTRSCNQDGNWTGTAPLCLGSDGSIVCGLPPQAPLSKFLTLSGSKSSAERLLQECRDLYGSPMKKYCTCMDTGRWGDLCHSSIHCEVKPSPPTGFHIQAFGPDAPHLIIVYWTKPNPSNSITTFQFRCNNSRTWEWPASYISGSVQKGFTPYSIVKCVMRFLNTSQGRSNFALSGTIRLPCAAPLSVQYLRSNSPSLVVNSDRIRWMYSFSWQEPKDINCDSLHSRYPYDVQYPTSSSNKTSVNTTRLVVYADREEKITFTVWARNTYQDSLSQPSTVTVIAPKIQVEGCFHPEVPAYASITPSSTVYLAGNTVTYNCTNGQTPREGNLTRSCGKDGTWTGVTPSCLGDKSTQLARVECPKEITRIADSVTGRGQVEIKFGKGRQILHLPIGKHPYQFTTESGKNCSIFIVIVDPTLIRRLVFEARYKVECRHLLDDFVTKQMIENMAKQHYSQVQIICAEDCNVTDTANTYTICTNDNLVIRWPTNKTFRGDSRMLPQAMQDRFVKRLSTKAPYFSIVIISKIPPIIYPLRNNDGTSARVILRAECTDGGTYNEPRDICEKSQP